MKAVIAHTVWRTETLVHHSLPTSASHSLLTSAMQPRLPGAKGWKVGWSSFEVPASSFLIQQAEKWNSVVLIPRSDLFQA